VGAIASADVVLVPALAVDGLGNRLGRGGGSFDRALARVGPLIPVIALLYDGELVERVPVEEHDTPVRGVVRPGFGVTTCGGGIPGPAARLCMLSSRIERVLI
jgi:5-formyltetrahydrofolate cyclo-ligase